jgi:hypothetical protein
MGKVQEVEVHNFVAKNAEGKDPSEVTTAALCFSSVVSGKHGQEALDALRATPDRTPASLRQAIAYADSFRLCQNVVIFAAAFDIPADMIKPLTTALRDHTVQAAGLPIRDVKALGALVADAIFLNEAAQRDLGEILATATQTGGQA